MKKITALVCLLSVIFCFQAEAQTRVSKNKKSRYYKNHTSVKSNSGDDFHIDGFEKDYKKRDARQNVGRKSKHRNYEVEIKSTNEVGKYRQERKIETVKTIMTAPIKKRRAKRVARKRVVRSRKAKHPILRKNTNVISKERIIYMSEDEKDFATTVVRKRYTSLDILADDLDVSKYQRPVFKGICGECDKDADNIIVNKNISSLEKNYRLKQAYMHRDKRLRETLDSQQYKKWHRIKDADEYLVLTKDPQLIDGVYK